MFETSKNPPAAQLRQASPLIHKMAATVIGFQPQQQHNSSSTPRKSPQASSKSLLSELLTAAVKDVEMRMQGAVQDWAEEDEGDCDSMCTDDEHDDSEDDEFDDVVFDDAVVRAVSTPIEIPCTR